jgi:DNA modification methylase
MKIEYTTLDSHFTKIRERSTWNVEKVEELKMHKIHVYPAKFPSFLISKSLEYARKNDIEINSIGDIFCGCGTTALEAKLNGKSFWGCDINPVATLIAKVKRDTYNLAILNKYNTQILNRFEQSNPKVPNYIRLNERINYWFKPDQITNLYKLLKAIKREVPKGKYQNYFLVAFSNILKRTSIWLTRSIKPTRHLTKKIFPVLKAYKQQFRMMYKATQEANERILQNPDATIVNRNFLKVNVDEPIVDLLITSPPYVTSYEYADLHQLSTLWLGYTQDFRTFRKGTIGSIYHEQIKDSAIDKLDPIAKKIYTDLSKLRARRPKSVVKYFIDMKEIIDKAHAIINPGGLAVFVIGNTTYKSVYIDNAKYLTKCMLDIGFEGIEVFKRKISSKMLTPYRDSNGKFSNAGENKKIVYQEEYVIIAKKAA